jgi:uncharacterized membrane protein required for colicin V production
MLACVATLFKDGIWSNAIRLINIILSALLAMNYFEPYARVLENNLGMPYTFLCDFIALWTLFTLFLGFLMFFTNKLSKVKLKFLKIVDQVGSLILAVWIGWMMVCFTLMTFHTAPLSRDFAGFAVGSDELMILGTAPDRQMLGFMQKQSLDYFGNSPKSDPEQCVFDPKAQFMLNYHFRRAKLESNNDKNGSLLVKGNWWD